MTENKFPHPDIQLDESTLHTFKKIVDSFPEEKRKQFSDSFNSVEDPSYKAEIIHNVILDAHPDLNQVPQVNRDMAQGAALGGPIGVGMGMMKGAIPQDVPSIIGKLTNVLGQGIPQATVSHPLMTAAGGPSAAMMATGAGQPSTGESVGGNPKTMSGQISGDALSAGVGGLMVGPEGTKLPQITGPEVETAESKVASSLAKKVTEVLQPPKKDMQSYIDRGLKYPAVEQASKVIKKSKNYGELRDNLDSVIKSQYSERADLLKKNNKEIPTDYTAPLEALIAKEAASGQANPKDLSVMSKVLENEKRFLGIGETEEITNATPEPSNPLDVLKAQSRKELMQDLTEKLLERRADGEKVITQPAKYKALDALRLGLKQSIEKAVPKVAPINETYNGLKEARWLASGQEALSQKEIPEGFLQKVAGLFSHNAAQTAMKIASDESGKLSKVTRRIESLQKTMKQF